MTGTSKTNEFLRLLLANQRRIYAFILTMVPNHGDAEDFESCNDAEGEGTRIYETWIDGYTDGTNGSTIGNFDPPFAECTIVHGGRQSMPLDCNNVNLPYYSEAYREFSPRQDWTAHGVGDKANP